MFCSKYWNGLIQFGDQVVTERAVHSPTPFWREALHSFQGTNRVKNLGSTSCSTLSCQCSLLIHPGQGKQSVSEMSVTCLQRVPAGTQADSMYCAWRKLVISYGRQIGCNISQIFEFCFLKRIAVKNVESITNTVLRINQNSDVRRKKNVQTFEGLKMKMQANANTVFSIGCFFQSATGETFRMSSQITILTNYHAMNNIKEQSWASPVQYLY